MSAFRSLGPLVCAGVLAAVAATGASSSAPASAPVPLPAGLQHRHDPAKIKQRRSDGVSESTNWSGYAVTTTGLTEVDGSWTVPALQSCTSGNDQYSSFWVGIDGFNSNSVEQTGTDSDCVNGQRQYYAWYEFYPHPAYYAGSLTALTPGDIITAKVTYSNTKGGTFTVTITDTNIKKGTFSTTAKMNAKRTSAEWIAEAPSSSGGVLSIANFGTVAFSSSHAARNGGAPGSIASFFEPGCNQSIACSNIVQEITMVQDNGAGAQPSGLTNGTDFTVTYEPPGHFSGTNGKK